MIDFPEWVEVSPCSTRSHLDSVRTRHGVRWEVWTHSQVFPYESLRVRSTRSIGR